MRRFRTLKRKAKKAKKIDYLRLKAQRFYSACRTRTNLSVEPSYHIWQWLLKIDPFVCYYSGVPLKKDDFSIDHKQPLKRGGTHDFSNLCVCTKGMNTAKGALTEKEFKDLLALISKWEDRGVNLLARLKISGTMFNRRK